MSRIVAGVRKGQKLVMPSHRHTRPTSDRVREAAFSLIADWAGTAGESANTMLAGFSFLDLFAGSGAVACEAASRGASPVVCVEKDKSTAAVARRNVEASDLDVHVVAGSVEQYLSQQASPFDVVWLDPPYKVTTHAVEDIVASVISGGWLAEDGLVVVERATRDTAFTWPEELSSTKRRRYGETTLYLASKEPL